MKQLKDVAIFRAGYPFRGRVPEVSDGDAHVIQMKDVDPELGVTCEKLTRTELTGRKQPEWLKPGDILFVARGFRNFALYLDELPGPTVLSPHFFHITLKPNAGILPAFLAWQINQKPAQQKLRATAEGSNLPSIRRAVLGALPIAVPSIEKQKKIVELDRSWHREQAVLRALTKNMKQTMTGLAQQLLHEA